MSLYPAVAGRVLKREDDVVTSLQLLSIGLVANGERGMPPLSAYPATLDLRATDDAGNVRAPTFCVRCILEVGDKDLMAAGIQWPDQPVFILYEHQQYRRIGLADAFTLVPAGETLPDYSVRDTAALVGTLTITSEDIIKLLEAMKG